MQIARKLLLSAGVFGIAVIAAISLAHLTGTANGGNYEAVDPEFLAPAELPPADLPAFNFARPRLPAPTSGDIAQIRARNPAYIDRLRQRAAQDDDLYSLIVLAYINEQTDLALVAQELLGQPFGDRANNVFLIAVGYDWLYDRFSDEQRLAVETHLLDGCRAAADYAREAKLSPYNVMLYNNPLQSLVACAIALYRTGDEADRIMSFTQDLWADRVIPVWRQVMGKNGGWHEGGEYVGIGIGQAVYRVPAMWRKATGVDYFESVPGLRGFLDFLIYRKQPDGNDFRWGDAGYFDRRSPDHYALAIEYQHRAAYSFLGCPRAFEPSAFPWGPLTTDTLCVPGAINALPLTRHFDGIGLIVSRSNWDKDATYVTFKAGDNFWSHSHLDQGAFTIFKGGALAIDSGRYGRNYGSEHHLNYTYQTVAHNVVTVTDPADTVPLRRDDKDVNYANDGGQRRIGSGWGLGPAPISLQEWQDDYETYHTGTLERLVESGGAWLAIADLTPAYTNALSGQGTFSARTRRINRYRRQVAYDPHNDVIVVFDRVEIVNPVHVTRWLLHAIDEPAITGNTFVIEGYATNRLYGEVLYPDSPRITAVGGPDAEFLVDGRNYPIDATTLTGGRLNSETGNWRLEISAPDPSATIEFLVALLPRLGSRGPLPQVSTTATDNELTVTIAGRDGLTTITLDRFTNDSTISHTVPDA